MSKKDWPEFETDFAKIYWHRECRVCACSYHAYKDKHTCYECHNKTPRPMNEDQKSGENLPMAIPQAIILDFIANSSAEILSLQADKAELIKQLGLKHRHSELIKNKVFVSVFPIDDWNTWAYNIYPEDIMPPFFKMPWNGMEYKSHDEALEAGIKEGEELIQKHSK